MITAAKKEIEQELEQLDNKMIVLKRQRKKLSVRMELYSLLEVFNETTLYPTNRRTFASLLPALLTENNHFSDLRFIKHPFRFNYVLERVHGYHEWRRFAETEDMWNECHEEISLGLFTENQKPVDEYISEKLLKNLQQDPESTPDDKIDTGKRILGCFHVPCFGVICHVNMLEKVSNFT